jgi:hypothetical protein
MKAQTTHSAARPECRTDAAPVSTILRNLASAPSGQVSLGTVLKAMGSRAHGLTLVLLALPDALPLPIPSTSTVLGIPLVIIAAHLLLYGEGSRLPRRVEAISVSPAVIRALARYAVPVLELFEKVSRPRWPALVENDRAVGVLCLYLAVLLLLPVPFFNAAPALCLIAIALGMIHRDGVMVAVGMAGTAAVTIALVVLADWAGELLNGWSAFNSLKFWE